MKILKKNRKAELAEVSAKIVNLFRFKRFIVKFQSISLESMAVERRNYLVKQKLKTDLSEQKNKSSCD